MKRIILSAIAVSMLAASAMSGQAAPLNQPVVPQSSVVKVDWKKPGHHDKVIVKKKVVRKSHWQRGQKYGDWRHQQRVNDWQRYHLRRPGPGQQWVRVGNDYILVSILSGVIASVIAGN